MSKKTTKKAFNLKIDVRRTIYVFYSKNGIVNEKIIIRSIKDLVFHRNTKYFCLIQIFKIYNAQDVTACNLFQLIHVSTNGKVKKQISILFTQICVKSYETGRFGTVTVGNFMEADHVSFYFRLRHVVSSSFALRSCSFTLVHFRNKSG